MSGAPLVSIPSIALFLVVSAPKISRAKPLATAPPEDSVQSEDLSRISKPSKVKMPLQHTSQELTDAASVSLASEVQALHQIQHHLQAHPRLSLEP